MRQMKVWLFGTVAVALLIGAGMLLGTASSRAEPERVVVKDHWHHHDGHWSYWHEGDKRWYYTDGSHWFYQDGGAWKTYGFDKGFGREGFERGEYRVPGADVKIVVPRHKVYHP